MTRSRTLDPLFAGIPWWDGTAIQFLCRVAAYGLTARLETVPDDPEPRVRIDETGWRTMAWHQALDVRDAHAPEIAALLERCPDRRFPWWD